jgi:hypothetical protein
MKINWLNGKTRMMMAALASAALLVGCGGGESEAPAMEVDEAPAPAAETETGSMGAPRVFFVAPADMSDNASELGVAFEFGVENFEIGAVPDPMDSVRAAVGHYHLGVGSECLPVGEIVPQAAPWVHFGDGSNTIEVQLEPGEYRMSVQVGDDEHRTLEGLCDTITIRVEDGI